MITLVHDIIDTYNSIFMDRRDPRVDGWFLMSSPFPTLALCLSYVYIVKVLGPRFMENRKALEFRKILIIYNAIQVAFSLWLFIEFGMGGWFRGYSFICQPVDYSQGEIAIRMVHAAWWYYFSKFTEFLDTIFFVLRKKQEHVSTLHVIHHGVMPMSVWFGVKFTPGGHSTFFGLLNSFVHIVMYFYYMMSAMGPQYTKYLWWKKHLTTLQMIQFVMIFAHSFQLAFVSCDYPRGFMWWIGGHAVLFFFLFAEFYKKAYYQRKAAKAARQSKLDLLSSVIPCTLHEDTKLNGHTNGHIPNGKTNGYVNGHANGHVNGYANGSVRQRPKENGNATKHQ